jgi:hypothetical protein
MSPKNKLGSISGKEVVGEKVTTKNCWHAKVKKGIVAR